VNTSNEWEQWTGAVNRSSEWMNNSEESPTQFTVVTVFTVPCSLSSLFPVFNVFSISLCSLSPLFVCVTGSPPPRPLTLPRFASHNDSITPSLSLSLPLSLSLSLRSADQLLGAYCKLTRCCLFSSPDLNIRGGATVFADPHI
jgi:hypothetical protein